MGTSEPHGAPEPMIPHAAEQLLAMLPAGAGAFAGSDYPIPVWTTFRGAGVPDMAALRAELLARKAGDVKELLEPLLLAAEQVEAAQADKAQFFLTDLAVQQAVFTGSKWRAGWCLVLGGHDPRSLIEKLQERSFMVFTDRADIPDTRHVGSRDTAPIYFLQLMLRYGLIWGRIAPGDDHEMGHFLEKDMPGLIVILDDLPPLKYLVTLGLMKLGAPAVVPSSFPFPYGYRAVADDEEGILASAGRFPNLRQRYYEDEAIALPDYCDPAHATEAFEAGRRLGGTADSLFCVRPAASAGERLAVVGSPAAALGILVEIAAEGLDDDIAAAVEAAALKAINFLPGVRVYEDEGRLSVDLAAGVELNAEQLGEAIYWGIRREYPGLKQIGVRLVYDPDALQRLGGDVRAYKAQRRQRIAAMTEANTDEFCACIECRPFSLVHTCILTPNRVPMCAARSYTSVKAGARFGSNQVPWKRSSDRELPLRSTFPKGELLDARRGEYAGCNQVYQEMTGGQLQRVFLHSLRDYPRTSCGCFQNLAFWIPEVAGIGIMSRHSPALAPDGSTWEMLANRAGGKQMPGIAGVSLQYIRSPEFLVGDGGLANVVWVDSALHPKLARLFAPGQKVATELDVHSVEELREFIGR